MTRVYRKSPIGHIIEERPEGLYFMGNLEAAKADVRSNVATSVSTFYTDDDTFRWTVEIGYGPAKLLDSGAAEWGVGSTEEDAWRFALGAHYGSYEDPIVNV